jgi:hypothetical protein
MSWGVRAARKYIRLKMDVHGIDIEELAGLPNMNVKKPFLQADASG